MKNFLMILIQITTSYMQILQISWI